MEEVLDKRKIKDEIRYLIKWIGWLSEYNSYELVDYLTNALKAVAAYERKLKRKRKGGDNGPAKRARR